MKTLAVIFALLAACCAPCPAQDTGTDIPPAVVLSVQTLDVIELIYQRLERIEAVINLLTPDQLEHLADALNQQAGFEAYTLGRLTRHRTGPENYLYTQIQRIRETAKTDTETAAKMVQTVIDQFKRFGVEL